MPISYAARRLRTMASMRAVAAARAVPVLLRDRRLERDDARRGALGVGLVREREQPRDVLLIRLARRGHLRVGQQVVVAVRKPEPRLAHGDDVRRRVLLVG